MKFLFIVVDWNGEDYFEKNIVSISGQKSLNETMYIINSNSEYVKDIKGKNIKIIHNQTNIGFGNSVNNVINNSDYDVAVIMNVDVYLDMDFTKKLENKFNKKNNIGIISPKILRFDKKTIDTCGQGLSKSFYPIDYGYDQEDTGQFSEEKEVFSACGACFAVRKELVSELLNKDGFFFDPHYFAFMEDLDLGWRISRTNYKILYCPDAVAYHYRAGSIKQKTKKWLFLKHSKEIKLEIFKNWLMTFIKNAETRTIITRSAFLFPRFAAFLFIILMSYPDFLKKSPFINHIKQAFKYRLNHNT